MRRDRHPHHAPGPPWPVETHEPEDRQHVTSLNTFLQFVAWAGFIATVALLWYFTLTRDTVPPTVEDAADSSHVHDDP